MLRKGIIAASGGGEKDPFFKNVSLLLRMNGTIGSRIFKDSSLNNFQLTAYGNSPSTYGAEIVTTSRTEFKQIGKFLGPYVSSTNSNVARIGFNHDGSAFAFGTQDFTVEFWAYRTGSSGLCRFINNPAWGLELGTNSNSVKWSAAGLANYAFNISAAPILNSWTHIAIVRYNNVLRYYRNGVIMTTVNNHTHNYQNIAGTMTIGSDSSGLYGFIGYLDEFRITKGVARYTNAFTPIQLPFPGRE